MQQELITLHRRIEATDTTLGILIAGGLALLLYQMGNKHLWHGVQFPFVVITLTGTLLCAASLVVVTNEDVDWLHVLRFEHGIERETARQLRNALKGGVQAFLRGQLVERTKIGLSRLAVLTLSVGATGYMMFGQRNGGSWFAGTWLSIAAFGVLRRFVVRWGR